ncbi:CHAT domain-containing protein [Microbacterium fluvii]|uniref:CHAT domain-containing protein n=1 Tax=Microbacterium fluvii TaxID=415215 RepID=UPI0021CF9A56|nr:CHAT domain-containing protein [Microbacterium fluvii]
MGRLRRHAPHRRTGAAGAARHRASPTGDRIDAGADRARRLQRDDRPADAVEADRRAARLLARSGRRADRGHDPRRPHRGTVASASDAVLYLYCHAEASAADTDASRLILTGSESLTLGELEVYAPTGDRLPGHPLVFINACESGELTPLFYGGFVSYFLAKGARGVIGTECKTPALFASEWAKAFFDELFAGTPLGETVLTLRRRFLADHANPLGLLYGVHCDVDTVVSPALPAR